MQHAVDAAPGPLVRRALGDLDTCLLQATADSVTVLRPVYTKAERQRHWPFNRLDQEALRLAIHP